MRGIELTIRIACENGDEEATLSGALEAMSAVAPHLLERGFCVIAPDMKPAGYCRVDVVDLEDGEEGCAHDP